MSMFSSEEKSLVKKDGKLLELFGCVVETPGGVVPYHLHQQELGEEDTSTTTQAKEDSPQGGEERKKTAKKGRERRKGYPGTSRAEVAGGTGQKNGGNSRLGLQMGGGWGESGWQT